jgi:hypothetical protein
MRPIKIQPVARVGEGRLADKGCRTWGVQRSCESRFVNPLWIIGLREVLCAPKADEDVFEHRRPGMTGGSSGYAWQIVP